MRVSVKRILYWVGILVLINLIVYYWHIKSKNRKPKVPHVYITPPSGDSGTCSFQNCPKVEKDALNVHLVPHSHIDVGWLKTVDQYYTGDTTHQNFITNSQCVKCTLETSIAELLKNKDRRFIFIEIKYFSRFWREIDEPLRQKIKQLIKERRFEIVNGGWVMSDAGVTMYNDIIDQHTLGFDWISQTLGPCAQSRTAWHVDQFGHSREHASIFSQMGYDSLFVGRIDYQDHHIRKESKNLEFVWETSPLNYGPKSPLFTQATYDGYYAPPNFVLDNVDSHVFEHSSTLDRFLDIMYERADSFKTNHLLVPMGSDFGYGEAKSWFENIDVLIEKTRLKFKNAKRTKDGRRRVNFIYSTPSCYTYYVNKENATFGTKKDDFLPYGIEPGHYWTGYFTTRGGMKMHLKRAAQILQSCKQLSIFTGLDGTFQRIHKLKDIVGVMQHHDAITGTQKLHVLNDYNKLMSEGIKQCEKVLGWSLNRLWGQTVQLHANTTLATNPSFCHDLNISSCVFSEVETPFLTTLYNPLSWTVSHWVRLPLKLTSVSISDHNNKVVPHQISVVPETVKRIPERQSSSDLEAVFQVTLPPMSVSSFTLQPGRGGQRPTPEQVTGDIVLENEFLVLKFKRSSGLWVSLENKKSKVTDNINQEMVYYEASSSTSRFSGAYVFVPDSAGASSFKKNPVKLTVYKNSLVQEVHQEFSPYASQVVRLYKGSRFVEVQWIVGPIDVKDTAGIEVISRFKTSLQNGDVFYSDSNGREILKRKRDQRESWDLQVEDKISGNYYPLTSRMYIQDKARNMQLTIMSDRPQGGGSINSGELEVMVHRRLRSDDGLGVQEALMDDGIDGQPIRFTGKHYICLDTIANSVELTRIKALEVHLAPTIMFTPLKDVKDSQALVRQFKFANTALPRNVHIITLDRISQDQSSSLLIRLEHLFEKNEDSSLSKPANVQLQWLFAPFEITSAEETTLGGNFHPNDLHKMKWQTSGGLTSSQIGPDDFVAQMEAPFEITIKPFEIRTFRVQIARTS